MSSSPSISASLLLDEAALSGERGAPVADLWAALPLTAVGRLGSDVLARAAVLRALADDPSALLLSADGLQLSADGDVSACERVSATFSRRLRALGVPPGAEAPTALHLRILEAVASRRSDGALVTQVRDELGMSLQPLHFQVLGLMNRCVEVVERKGGAEGTIIGASIHTGVPPPLRANAVAPRLCHLSPTHPFPSPHPQRLARQVDAAAL